MLNRRTTTCDAPSEIGCVHANAAADRAVEKTFSILGVDINKPESVEAFRDDLRFNRTLKRYADRGAIAFIGAAAVAFAGMVWMGITGAIRGNH